MVQSENPRQVTSQRIIDCLRDNELVFFVDSNGELGTLSNSRLYQFILMGEHREILVVRGRWNRVASIDRANEILEICNKWNTATIWPKSYYRVKDDGEIAVMSELCYDLEYGVTDSQINDILHCGVQTGGQFFDELDAAFPDPVKAAR